MMLNKRAERVLLEHDETQAALDRQRALWAQQEQLWREQSIRALDRGALLGLCVLCFLAGSLVVCGEWVALGLCVLCGLLGRAMWREMRHADH